MDTRELEILKNDALEKYLDFWKAEERARGLAPGRGEGKELIIHRANHAEGEWKRAHEKYREALLSRKQ